MESSVETQITWVGALYNAIMYMLLDTKDFRLTVSALYKRRALFISFLCYHCGERKKLEGDKYSRN